MYRQQNVHNKVAVVVILQAQVVGRKKKGFHSSPLYVLFNAMVRFVTH